MDATDDLAVPAVVETPARRAPVGGALTRWLLRHQTEAAGALIASAQLTGTAPGAQRQREDPPVGR